MPSPSADTPFGRVVPDVVRRSYAAKFLVAFVLMIVIIGAIGANIYVQTGQEVERSTKTHLQSTSKLHAATLDQWLDRMHEQTRLLSGSEAVKSRDAQRINPFLTYELNADDRLPPEVTAIHYYDRLNSKFTASTSEEFVGVNPQEKGMPWTDREIGITNTTMTEPYRSPVTGEPVIAFVSPIPGQADRALVLVVNLEKRAETLVESGDDVHLVVVNDEGTIVLSDDPDEILTSNAGERGAVASTAVEKGLQGTSGYTTATRDGATFAMGFAPVESGNWVVMPHAHERDAFALRRSVSRSLLLLVLASVIGFGLIGATIGRNTVTALDALASKAAELEDGNLETEIESARRDEIGDLFDSFESMRDSLRETIEAVETAKEEAESARADTEAAKRRAEEEQRKSRELVQHLETKAESYRQAMDDTAEGDLTRRVDPESRSEAMTDIGEAFNKMVADLEAIVVRIQDFADGVATSSAEASAGSDEIRTAGEEVSETVRTISESAARQDDNLQSVSSEMGNLSATIEEVAASADEVADVAAATANRGEDGSEFAEEAIRELDRIEREADDAIDEVEALETEIEEIGDILDLITDIAEQTNMLALNASIEAARAGEAGEGFAVVADEIKTLADETEEATGEIEALVESTQRSTNEAADGMQELGDRVTTGRATIEQALDALEDIVERVEDANDGVQSISDATQEQATTSEEVVAMVDEVTEISERTTTEARNVATATEKQASSIEEVSANVESLAGRADELRDLLEEFDVRRDGAENGDGTVGEAGTSDGAASEAGTSDGTASEAAPVEGGGNDDATPIENGSDD